MAVVGRRPGRRDTRADILAAAREAFIEEGYERPSLRGIARRAGVDPALVHHYFDGKPDLYAHAINMGRDLRDVVMEMGRLDAERGGCTGTDLVEAFLRFWEQGRPDNAGVPPFLVTAQAVTASPEAAAGFREYLEDRVWSLTGADHPPGEREQRRSLIASQLIGLAWARYLLCLEPLASAPPEEVGTWVGPTLDRYMRGPLPAPRGPRAVPGR